MPRAHVIGAGLAGLSAAVRLVKSGVPTTVYEAAGHAGGRCRSFYDNAIDRNVDNGNHLVLEGNTALASFVDSVGARGELETLQPARFAFFDLPSGEHWHLAPGRWPWWALQRDRLPPGVTPARLVGDLIQLARSDKSATIDDTLDTRSASFRRIWSPIAVAALNTATAHAAASGLWAVVRETLVKGERASRPILFRRGLSPALIDPAVAWLESRGCAVRFNARLRALEMEGRKVSRLAFGSNYETLKNGDSVILAMPPAASCELLPELTPPDAYSAILNAHFAVPDPLPLPHDCKFLGILGGTAEWLFQRDDVISVTVSAANRFRDKNTESLAADIWSDVTRILGGPDLPMPPYRIITEKRATVSQTPQWERHRPKSTTNYVNLALAGDWIGTGIPATLEGAVRSGIQAADVVLARS